MYIMCISYKITTYIIISYHVFGIILISYLGSCSQGSAARHPSPTAAWKRGKHFLPKHDRPFFQTVERKSWSSPPGFECSRVVVVWVKQTYVVCFMGIPQLGWSKAPMNHPYEPINTAGVFWRGFAAGFCCFAFKSRSNKIINSYRLTGYMWSTEQFFQHIF